MLKAVNQVGNEHLRLCVACRQQKPQQQLLRLTVNNDDGVVYLVDRLDKLQDTAFLKQKTQSDCTLVCLHAKGRSAYLCRNTNCLEQGLKGVRVKHALSGRPPAKTHKLNRTNAVVKWPLEAQLIKVLTTKCTEAEKTCQNTQGKEGLE